MSNNPADHIALRLAKTTYVILARDAEGRLTLLADPGMGKPWSTKNKRLADFHAKNCDGEARLWGEAFQLLLKENPNFEKELYQRLAQAQGSGTAKIAVSSKKPDNISKQATSVTKTILDQHGRPAQ